MTTISNLVLLVGGVIALMMGAEAVITLFSVKPDDPTYPFKIQRSMLAVLLSFWVSALAVGIVQFIH